MAGRRRGSAIVNADSYYPIECFVAKGLWCAAELRGSRAMGNPRLNVRNSGIGDLRRRDFRSRCAHRKGWWQGAWLDGLGVGFSASSPIERTSFKAVSVGAGISIG